MEKIIKKADVLIEALPYIQRFREAIIVVKFGGSAMEDPRHSEGILTDVAFMECAGMLPVIVHGGGKAISRALKAQQIEPKFVKGLRVTCAKTMSVVDRVMKKELNPAIVADLVKKGAAAEGISGEEIFTVEKVTEKDESTGEVFEWGYVGEPIAVNVKPVKELLKKNVVPVITPVGRGGDGHLYNINADTAASALAAAIRARKLVFLSDVPGLLRNPEDPVSIIGTLKTSEVDELVEKGVIDGGMLPKVQSAVKALRAGVKKVHMIDGRLQHSLLLEIFTDKGVGTEIIADE